MKAIKQARTRNILELYNKEDISYSRMNEMFNELADEFAIGFFNWAKSYQANDRNNWGLSATELLEIYKKETGL